MFNLRKIFVFFIFFSALPEIFSANNSSLFYCNESRIYDEFKSVALIENLLWENSNVLPEVIAELKKGNAGLLYTPLKDTSAVEIPFMGIPSFYWGFVPGFAGGFFGPCAYGIPCFMGPAGVLMFYLLTDENKEETKKAIYGCALGTALGAVTSITAIIFFYGYILLSMQ